MPPKLPNTKTSRAKRKKGRKTGPKPKILKGIRKCKKEPIEGHICKTCSKVFDSKTLKLLHQKHCKKENIDETKLPMVTKSATGYKYSCNECNKKFSFAKSFAIHLNNEHSKVPGSVPCKQCTVRCPNKTALNKHIKDIHNRTLYNCDHCDKKFVRYAHVLRHLSQKGCDGQGVAVYPCEICNAQFSRKDNLMVHLRLQHITQKTFACKQCSYSTRTFSKLILHVQCSHSESPPQFICDHCGKVTSSRAGISKHMEIHGEKKYACDVCGYSTFTIEVMRRHVLTHVRDKPYKCSVCSQSFIQRVQLQRHLERHTATSSKFRCKDCDQAFDDKDKLLEHLVGHIGEKKPADSKPFVCEVCDKCFSTKLGMRRHVLSHTLERPRRCMYCATARAYVRGEQLVRHVRLAHPTVFREHLSHVRQVLGSPTTVKLVRKSELDTILNVLDAEADRIMQGCGEGVLYGGMQEIELDPLDGLPLKVPQVFSAEGRVLQPGECVKSEHNPLMTEEELTDNLNSLLSHLIDKDTLECFGWPNENVDTVLEKVIEQCGARPADRSKWTRVQCMRENAKHLFLYVIEDKNIARMLGTHTIDQIVKHILAQVAGDQDQ